MTVVLAALDADACARPVLGTALALAAVFNASALALHVGDGPSGTVTQMADAANVQLREETGSEIEQITAAAEQPDVAALVIGLRRVRGGHQPAGHLATEIISRVQKPVVVVPPHAYASVAFARILAPLEGTAETSHALEETLALARTRGIEVLVLHVHSPSTVPAFSDHDPHATRVWEREFLSRHVASPHHGIRLLRRLGTAADDIVKVAQDNGVDLIVLAWNQRLGDGNARIVTETLAHTNIPVLLLPIRQSREPNS